MPPQTPRKIVLDTETTGINPQNSGIIEIAAIELIHNNPTGNFYQQYINPHREIEKGAFDVHKISNEFLQDKPSFKDIIQDFLDFISSDTLIIHNADFDISMINTELSRINLKPIQNDCIDTLITAQRKLPGQKHSLDALCKFYNIDTSRRQVHSALVDVQLLSQVYAQLVGEQQQQFSFSDDNPFREELKNKHVTGNQIVKKPSDEEQQKHQLFIKNHFPSA
jgi:DNA polymerase-3 subunit epsilon